MNKQLILFALLTLLLSCGKQSTTGEAMYDMASFKEEMGMEGEPVLAEHMSQSFEKTNAEYSTTQKIIKEGQMHIRVNQLAEARKKTDSLISNAGGYCANEHFSSSDWESTFSLTIRIPASKFYAFVDALENGGGEILYKTINARDVTEEFIDLETRLDNKRKYLERYNQLLSKAKSIKEMLEIEEKIRVLQEEIESTTGLLKYLANQVSYSTLQLEITQKKDYKFKPNKCDKFTERLKQSVSKGWFAFIDFTLFLLRLWPFWFIIAGVVYLWKNIRKRKRIKGK